MQFNRNNALQIERAPGRTLMAHVYVHLTFNPVGKRFYNTPTDERPHIPPPDHAHFDAIPRAFLSVPKKQGKGNKNAVFVLIVKFHLLCCNVFRCVKIGFHQFTPFNHLVAVLTIEI